MMHIVRLYSQIHANSFPEQHQKGTLLNRKLEVIKVELYQICTATNVKQEPKNVSPHDARAAAGRTESVGVRLLKK